MPRPPRFSRADQELIARVSQEAEELTGDYFRLPSFGPKRYVYEVSTAAAHREGEDAPGAFAQICRYVRSPPVPGERQRAARYYRVCLQDASILEALERQGVPFCLETLLRYIMTHELIHIVRFEQFRHPFLTDPGEKEAEERRVHALTYDLLERREDPKMASLLGFYRTHRMPRCF
ncbi:MAG: hypothetical protein RBU30_05680 [Polyangia bacterium]|jgi:hypothetical protein|nr:hypothetical protein [Polyangia bacterium]